MLATTAASAWGITDAVFLWGYGSLCAVGAIGIWHERRRVLGPAPTSRDPQPDLSASRLALLSGGPDRAITAAAAQLFRDGRLRERRRRAVGERRAVDDSRRARTRGVRRRAA